MKRLRLNPTKTRLLSCSTLILALGLTGARTVQAGLTYESSSASVTYSIYNTGSGSGLGTFSNGMLTYAGGGLPALTTQVAGSSQTYSFSSNSPLIPLSFTNSATTTPAEFGSASTDIYSGYSGTQGGKLTQGGVYWTIGSTLYDNLPSGSSLASVAFSTATAGYTNTGSSSVTITPGSLLSVAGALNGSTGFVAAGMTTTITVTNSSGTVIDSISVDPIILASGEDVNIAEKGSNSNDYASITDGTNGAVTGSASNLASSLTILAGDSVSVTSNLTLISDPGSNIGVSDTLPPDLTVTPDFGGFGATPYLVPEPSTFVLLASGLALLGLGARSRLTRSKVSNTRIPAPSLAKSSTTA